MTSAEVLLCWGFVSVVGSLPLCLGVRALFVAVNVPGAVCPQCRPWAICCVSRFGARCDVVPLQYDEDDYCPPFRDDGTRWDAEF